MRYIVSYDIANERRRRRLVKFLEDYMCRIQYSVFTGDFDESILENLKRLISYVIEPDEDSVLIVPLCVSDWQKRLSFGVGRESAMEYEKEFQIL